MSALRKLPATKKVRHHLRLCLMAASFAHSRDCAKHWAKAGNTESARWWGAVARQDWAALQHLILS